MSKYVWVVVHCQHRTEATKIGRRLLRAHQIACYDIIRRESGGYFWPPKARRLVTSGGYTLQLTTVTSRWRVIVNRVKNLHSDRIPFIAAIPLTHLAPSYGRWLNKELRAKR